MASIPPPRTFARIGGHAALDLINTVQWRLSPARFEEDLVAYEHVLAWTRQSGLVSDEEVRTLARAARRESDDAEAESARVRTLREALYAALFSGADTEPVLEDYRDAVAHGRLTVTGTATAWKFPVDLALPRRRIALQAFDVLMHADWTRLGQCHDAECGWVYLDTSPRHNRRWCVSADCGNRNRVREHYERARAAEPTQPSTR